MNTLYEVFIRIFFISALEECFINFTALLLLKEYGLFKKNSRYKCFILIFFPSILSNILKYTKVDSTVCLLTGIVFTIVTIKIISNKNWTKVSICVLISFVIFMTTETLSILLLTYITKYDLIALMRNNVNWALIASSLERVFQALLLVIFFIKSYKHITTEESEIGVFDLIRSSRTKRRGMILLLSSNIMFLLFCSYLFIFKRILEDIEWYFQLTSCVFIVALPFFMFYYILEFTYKDFLNSNAYHNHFKREIYTKVHKICNSAVNCGNDKVLNEAVSLMHLLDNEN